MDVLYTAKINMLGLGMNVYVYVCVVGGRGIIPLLFKLSVIVVSLLL